MSPESAEVKRWFVKATHDRRAAELAVGQRSPMTDVAAFHTQQAIEKFLKGYLVFSEDPFEKIHDLEELTDRCAQHDAGFAELKDRVKPITPYAVRYRYPGPEDPTVEQVRAALIVVGEVEAFVLGRVPPEMHP